MLFVISVPKIEFIHAIMSGVYIYIYIYIGRQLVYLSQYTINK